MSGNSRPEREEHREEISYQEISLQKDMDFIATQFPDVASSVSIGAPLHAEHDIIASAELAGQEICNTQKTQGHIGTCKGKYETK